jgi:LysR family transcriptional regulator (chromosome initiation inhibitor)
MFLSSLHIEAFVAVVKYQSFTEAAKQIHVTQSALSQRILNLEEKIQLTLFIRRSDGIYLTEAGEKLFRHCQLLEKMEGEVLEELLVENNQKKTNHEELRGMIKIAGFSSFVRSLLIPRLGVVVRKFPMIHIDIMTKEVHELTTLLKSGQVDFIFSTFPYEKENVECILVGEEKNVLIESIYKNPRIDYYIDHDELDTTTEDFWKKQHRPLKKYKRIYFDEIYSIIQAVEKNFGRAVVPYHLIEKNKNVYVVKGLQPLIVPIYLCYYK